MKLAGAHGSIALVPRRNSRATLPGLLSPHSDHTCGWTTSALHSHDAWQYWFRWGCGTSSTTSFIADLAGGRIPYPRSTSPDHAALHPLRRDAPDPSRRTRYVAMHPLRRDAPDQKGCNAYGSGAPPSTTSTTSDNPSPQTPTVRIGRCNTASTCSPRLRTRGATPFREHYTS